VHDGGDSIHRRFYPLTHGQVTGEQLTTFGGLATAPAEYAYVFVGVS
jgi:hypothetical protein